MNRIALTSLCTMLLGCTSMPDRFHPGSPSFHPRFGYSITNETPDSFDLEIIVLDYSYIYTHGDSQIEEAKRVFLKFLRKYAEKSRIEIVEPPAVELNVFQVRNHFDGTNTTRVGKRIALVSDRRDRRRTTRLRLTNRGS